MLFRSYCTEVFSQIRKSSTFLTIHYYNNNWGEVADHSICFHVDYLAAVRRAKKTVKDYNPKSITSGGFTLNHLQSAKLELLDSFDLTLAGNNPYATSAHAYDEITDAEGQLIPGIKLHRNQDLVHLWGFGLHKRVISPGNYGPDNRMPLTLAKDHLRNLTSLGNFVQFKLQPGRFKKLVVEKLTVKEADVIRLSEGFRK